MKTSLYILFLFVLVGCGGPQLKHPTMDEDLVSDLGHDLPVRATAPVVVLDGEPIPPHVFHRFFRETLYFDPGFYKLTLNAIVERFVDDLLMVRAAMPFVQQVTDEEIDQEMVTRFAGHQRSEALSKIGQTEAEYRETLRQRLAMKHKLASDIVINDETLEAFFDEHRDAFELPSGYRVRLLTLALPKDRKERASIDLLAADLFNAMTADDPDYEAIAKKADGLGFGGRSVDHERVILRPFLDKAVIDQLDKMNPGETSHPIATRKAIRIVYLVDFVPVKVRMFDDVKDEIRRRMVAEESGAKRQELLESLRESTAVESHTDRMVRNLDFGRRPQPRNQATSQ